MKRTTAVVLASLVGSSTAAFADNAPIAPDFTGTAPRLHIDRSLVASPAMNRIEPTDSIAFATDSAALEPAGYDIVDSAAKYLRMHPDRRIVLEGHTDQAGASVYNEDLATRRMQTVRDRMMAWGVKPDRIVMITYGEREATELDNPGDRRVVMFATRQAPQTVIAQQLQHRNVIVATWTDRNSLMTLEPGKPPVARTARR